MQAWQQAECSGNWCQAAGLNIRGMRFARDVEGQLEAAIESSRSPFFEGALRDGTIGRSQKRRRTGHSPGMHQLLCLLWPCRLSWFQDVITCHLQSMISTTGFVCPRHALWASELLLQAPVVLSTDTQALGILKVNECRHFSMQDPCADKLA